MNNKILEIKQKQIKRLAELNRQVEQELLVELVEIRKTCKHESKNNWVPTGAGTKVRFCSECGDITEEALA